jgi:cell division septum initiation protein DivIVA
VSLDRQSIEKKDFPIGRRGYDPEAVDGHLSALADEVDQLRRASRKRTDTLAAAASDQVRAIVEAAENSAAEIQRQAEEEAREIRAEADSEAKRVRGQATEQARDYVGKVSESTTVMVQRVDAMESELQALVESLRTGANRLNADLALLVSNMTELRDSAETRPSFEPEPGADAYALDENDENGQEAVLEVEEVAVIADVAPAGGQDTEGARLIALNMALNGTPREETDRYLADHFELDDRGQLLDEVYASVEG